ncbi:XRE family transcriptional regulator [Enterobacter hormaechei subsp. steigerwaltii]|uniref:ImmA/IrrE family metallo-endopeptidase n=1 Tax=Enterobacter hormaechei TaxID=158836 RepID=UPI0005EEC7BE|nr:ImmA/IrrE family metallo-endopeptidase [Enterobacter hormaechei]KJN12133.1 XRE family transcriptional regulator [Enterobacter hormaechei subsp. steigerwaltii]KJN20709.1 XRE family transcriptional regulator [Enterobacter hormaechei subsp. steigerwaltii]
MADLAYINPQIFNWARARAQVSEEDLSQSLGVKLEKVISWSSGAQKPTFGQAQKLASKLHIPFAFFFLPAPPQDTLPIPDLRTPGNHGLVNTSIDLKDTIASVIRRQEWFKDYLKEQGAEALSFVGSYNLNSDPADVARNIRQTLKLDDLNPRGLGWEEYQRKIVEGAEAAGILVMRSGIVENNTRRTLSVSEFRGFAISDRHAPVIFVNLRDAPSARLFTLIHELAHLWLGQSGVSSGGVMEDRREEQFCNAVAGEFLAPARDVTALWDKDKDLYDNVADIAKIFHVSRYVIIRRAYDLGLVSFDTYQEYYRELINQFTNADGGGGNFYAIAKNKNSALFSKVILNETLSGRVLLRDAGKLLGISPAKIKQYATEIGA